MNVTQSTTSGNIILENARAFFSTNLQLIVTLTGIILAVTFVVVQFATQEYGARLGSVYLRRSRFLFVVASISVLLIVNSLFLVELTERTAQSGILFGIVSLIVTISLLVWHVNDTLERLNPQFAVGLISQSIREEKLIALVAEEWEEREYAYRPTDLSSKKDPIAPLMDVARSSIKRSDLLTLNEIMATTHRLIGRVLRKCSSFDQKEGIILHFVYHLDSILETSIVCRDERSAAKVINTLGLIADSLGRIELGGDVHVYNILRSRKYDIVKNGWIKALSESSEAIGTVGSWGAQDPSSKDVANWAVDELSGNVNVLISMSSTDDERNDCMRSISNALRRIGQESLASSNLVLRAVNKLGFVVMTCLSKNMIASRSAVSDLIYLASTRDDQEIWSAICETLRSVTRASSTEFVSEWVNATEQEIEEFSDEHRKMFFSKFRSFCGI
jgi:hypothetical protein